MKTTTGLAVAIALAIPLFGQTPLSNSTWRYDSKRDIAGTITETAITDQTSGVGTSDSLVVRCKTNCEVYIHIGNRIVDEQSSVRVKFNDHAPGRYAVSVGQGSTSLFFKTPTRILRAMRDNGGHMTVETSAGHGHIRNLESSTVDPESHHPSRSSVAQEAGPGKS